ARIEPSTSAISMRPLGVSALSSAARRARPGPSAAVLVLIRIFASWVIYRLLWFGRSLLNNVPATGNVTGTAHQFKRLFLGLLIRSTYARCAPDEGAQGGRRAAFVLGCGGEARVHAVGRLAADRGPRARGGIDPDRAQSARDPADRR